MPLTIGYSTEGLEGKTAGALDDVVAALQTWANQVDGVNAAERLSALATGLASVSSVPPGALFMWGTPTAPTGYLLCDGSPVSRVTYTTLFTLLGISYGAGDGVNTFNVPDLRGRFALGKAAAGTGSTLAGTGGAIDHTHSTPAHTHTVSGTTANESAHTHTYSGTTSAGNSFQLVQNGLDTNVAKSDHTHTYSGTTSGGSAHSHGAGSLGADSGGSGTSGTANPPFLAVHYIIKV